MPGSRNSPPKLNAIKKARIVTYDTEKVIKKLKIKENSIAEETSTHFQTYNLEMENLLSLHSATLVDLDKEFDKNVKIAIQNRDRSQMSGVKKKIRQTIPPIRNEVNEHEKVLNEALESILTEKQNKKWLKYQKRKNPNTPHF